MSQNRRDFLRTAAAGAAAVPALGLPAQVAAQDGIVSGEPGVRRAQRRVKAPQDAEIAALYERSVVIDSLAVGHEWDEVEYAAVEATGYTAIQTTLPSQSFEIAARALEEWNARVTARSDLLINARTAADIERAKREGKMAVVYGFQNATMIERSLDNIERLYELGTRCIQLTYNDRNLLANGCLERVDGGLSDFGVAAVRRMNELGIIVDLSHCGKETTMDGVALSEIPACFTHTMCDALYPGHPRAKTDDQIRAMALRGGVIGIAAIGYFVGPDPGGETTIENYIDHIEHAVGIAGVDQVGICTDYQIRGIEAWATRETWYEPRLTFFKPTYQVRWPPWIPELDETDRFRNVAQGLARRGYGHEEIEKILGRNWLEYFRSVFRG